MNLTYLIINVGGIALIAFTLWWFFWSKPKPMSVQKTNTPIDILVKDGIYQPAQIQIPADKEVKLRFVREDATPCAEYVLFPTLNLSYQLPLNEAVEISIPPQVQGEIDFHCQMAMYKGKLIIIP